jgi:hypothetical protein
MLIYIDKVTSNRAAFETKVIDICKRLGIDSNWLMATMWIESDLNHTAVNSASGATGLIQFLPSTAISLGTTVGKIKAMSNLEQLDWVYKYMKQYASKINNFTDCYFAVFFPAAIGKYSDWVLQSYGMSAEYVAGQNSGYDINKDNELTFREVESKILLAVDPEYREILKADKVTTVVDWDAVRIAKLILSIALLVAGGWMIYKLIKR